MTTAVQLLAMPVFQAPSTIETALALRPGNVAVPTPEQKQQRSVHRYREKLMRDRRRAGARGRALLLTRPWRHGAGGGDFSRGLSE
jgi:hypothetical protein